MSEYGTIAWPSASNPIWQLNWALADSPDQEGLAITQARYRGHQVFYKASLPSLRVQYNGSCGPYKDPLNYNNAQPTSSSGSSRVNVYTINVWGFSGIAVEAYHRIGAYRLTERWTFWQDGQVYPRLFSAGLQCNDDHRHHAYWRLDFDIDGASSDTVFEYNTSTPNLGWGPGWHQKQTEISRVKNPATQRCWAIMDGNSTRGYFLIPGSTDGSADGFSTRDLWVLRYRGSEDRHGQQGSAYDDGLAAYLSGEPVVGQDIVLWYCGHLAHEAEHGGDEWHATGPRLVPFRWA
jgi:Cu2+-containing amine oxidase